MWAPTTDKGTPSLVSSTTIAARRTRSRGRDGRCKMRAVLDPHVSTGEDGDPPAPRLALLVAGGSHLRRRQRANAAEVQGSPVDPKPQPRPPAVRRRRMGEGPPPFGQCAWSDLIAQRRGDLLRLPGPGSLAVVRPRLFEHEDVDVERGAHRNDVERATPAIDSGVHVEVGDSEHVAGRR